jgi:predicted RNA binding protein YcfA (HicA-like mRNA interferase family)
MKHSDGRITVVPVHPGEEIGTGLLLKIIKDTGLSRDEFIKMLEEV